MKNFIIVIFLLISAFSLAQSQVVGQIVDNEPVFTVDETELINTYNTNMQLLTNLDVNFSNVQISQIDNEYFLVFSNNDFSVKSSLAITLSGPSNNLFYVESTTSCTTSDCSESNTGCVPKAIMKGCTPCPNEGECTKTVSSGSLIEL